QEREKKLLFNFPACCWEIGLGFDLFLVVPPRSEDWGWGGGGNILPPWAQSHTFRAKGPARPPTRAYAAEIPTATTGEMSAYQCRMARYSPGLARLAAPPPTTASPAVRIPNRSVNWRPPLLYPQKSPSAAEIPVFKTSFSIILFIR